MIGKRIEFWYGHWGRLEWGYVISEHKEGYRVNLLGTGNIISVEKKHVVE